jgi:energy-coupling factor transporter ATP-binding protein EcfA2
MIHSLIVRDPKNTPVAHWDKVSFLKGVERLEFKPGLNILYAPNGSGKSTVISAVAKLLHCYHTNWPAVTRDSVWDFSKKYLCNGLVLEHDGAPARYMGLEEISLSPDKGVVKVPVSLLLDKTEKAQVLKALHQQSAGQAQLTRLTRFLGTQPEKVRASVTRANIGKDFVDLYDVAVESLKNVTKSKARRQQVIILDEVDKSLDFAKQARVWGEIDRLNATGEYQFIIASHSPWAAKYTEGQAHYIEPIPGYLENTRAAINVLLGDFAPHAAAVQAPPKAKRSTRKEVEA